MSTLAKTSNAAFKQYKREGGQLGFTEFLHREKEKMFSANGQDDTLLLVNRSLNDTVQTAINDTLKKGGMKDQTSGNTIFGINAYVLTGSAALVIASVIYLAWPQH